MSRCGGEAGRPCVVRFGVRGCPFLSLTNASFAGSWVQRLEAECLAMQNGGGKHSFLRDANTHSKEEIYINPKSDIGKR